MWLLLAGIVIGAASVFLLLAVVAISAHAELDRTKPMRTRLLEDHETP